MMKFKKIAAVFLSVMLAVGVAALSACNTEEQGEGQLSFLVTDGELVKNGKGESVLLRGINAGGLFVTEHWMTGFKYNTTPSNDYRSLTQTFIQRFGEEQTKALWAEYRANWWTETDFQNCADMGMNVIRLPFTYMNVDFAAVTDLENAGKEYDFSDLDDFVEKAAEYGMYTILDLHGAYGSQNGQDHSGQIISDAANVTFYYDQTFMGLTENLWKALAEHYKDNPAVAGYDILNEPGEKAGSTSERHWQFYDRIYDAIRSTGDEHIIIFESCWDGANLPAPATYGWENCMYSFHHYADSDLSAQEHGVDWNAKIANVTSQNFGVPLQMGEFTSYTSAEKWEYTLDLMNRSGWHWTSWTYKVWGNMPWGVVNVIGGDSDKVNAASDDYEVILEKFQKLRTDGENAQKYTFYEYDENGEKTPYKTLEELFTEYCNASFDNGRLEEGEYVLYEDEGWLAVTDGLLCITDNYNNVDAFKIAYHSSDDGSAYLTANGKYLSVTKKNDNYYITLTSAADDGARFYIVACGDAYALVSYTACKYLRVGADGALTADCSGTDGATLFYVSDK